MTGNQHHRGAAGIPLGGTTSVPFDGHDGTDRPAHLARLLDDPGSGLDRPAAVIVETVQGEGGVNVARPEWLRALAELCRHHEILLIVDDVQMGCGRTGPFFSFEDAGIVPDMVCLSKSISGYGLPLALTLIRPELDVWRPGAHNGTFRGVNVAFVTATEALRTYWRDDALEKSTRAKGERVAGAVSAEAFARGLLTETSGPRDEVVKLLPPLTISDADLSEGLAVLEESVRVVLERTG